MLPLVHNQIRQPLFAPLLRGADHFIGEEKPNQMDHRTDALNYDQTGKISLDHVYNEPDPKAYFSTLRKLGYRVPEEAKPVFQRLLSAKREATGEDKAKLVDVGCSYGVNAALLKHGMSLEDLYRLYGSDAPDDHGMMLTRDQGLFTGAVDDALSVVGVDAAERAIAYAVDAGVLDAGVATNLEKRQPTSTDVEAVENADMIISTGCVGYVTRTSLERLVETSLENNVWMANFVLRMFDYEPVEQMMAERGYVTEKLAGAVFPQRRFASEQERQRVLDNVSDRGLSPDGLESTGWYFAELHVSRPANDGTRLPLETLLAA